MSDTKSKLEVIQTAWPRSPLSEEESRGNKGALIAIERYNAIEYRDETGALYHQYQLPMTEGYFHQFRHYFRYFGTRFHDLHPNQIKFKFLFHVLALVRKVAAVRKRVSILEIGVTLGENYLLLRDAIRSEGLEIDIDYVGIDNDGRVVALARELQAHDRNFWIVNGDGSDLGRFADNSFDLVVSNTVHNILTDHDKALGEAFRVARLAFFAILMTTLKDEPFVMRHAMYDIQTKVFTAKSLKQGLKARRAFWVYELSKFWSQAYVKDRTDGSDGSHLDAVDAASIRWTGWIFAKERILPEMNLLESRVEPETLS
jgi:ubiquinone/menaquinone biosynthesis C-methylase UbiE